MARLSFVSPDTAPPAVLKVYRALGYGRRPNARIVNSFQLLAHSPEGLKWLYPFFASVHPDNPERKSAFRYRVLAVIRTSRINACAY